MYLALEVLGLSLCAVSFNPNVGQFQSEAKTEQSIEVPRLHKAELVWSSGSGAGNQMESVKDAVWEKTKYSEYSTPKLYRGLYINGSGAITDARSGTNTESEYRTEWHKESGMVWNVEIAIYGKHVNGEWFWNINKG